MKNNNSNVQRHLKTRHITMIAIGGAIGSGLFMASGGTIAAAGPGGALIAYAAIGLMVYFLMTSLGEMATYLPVTGSFSTYASRFVDPSLGFALGWNYWINWVITVAADVTFAAMIIQYWKFGQFLPTWAWSLIYLAIIFGLNILSVRVYGESEFWFAAIKVITVLVFIVIGTLTILGIFGGEFVGLTNFMSGEGPFIGGDGSISGKLLSALGVFLIAGYSFQGTELIGITAGESEDPKKAIPKAIKQVFWRILLFYIVSIAILALLIPYTSPELINSEYSVAQSPFVIVFTKAGFALAAGVMNAVILTSILSAGNSGMYASTRMLYAMGKDKMAWSIFARTTKNGIPYLSLILTTAISLIFVIFAEVKGSAAIDTIVASSGLTGFIAWLGIALSHYRFRRAYVLQGYNLDDLPYKAKWFPIGPLLALALCILVIIGQDTSLLLEGDVNWTRIIITYIAIPVMLVFYGYHKIKYKTKIIPLKEMDLSKDH